MSSSKWPPEASPSWQAPVVNAAALPTIGNASGDARVDKSTDTIYIWNGTSWLAVATPGAAIAIDGLNGDVSASGPGVVAATVNSVGGSSAANIHSAELAANAATSSNTASTIVKRDASGNFSAGTITANLTGTASGNATGSGSANGTNTGDVALAAVGSSPNANAASLSGQVLNLQPFDSTHPGVVTASGGGTTNFLRADGTWAAASGGGGTPGGNNKDVQFNDSGAFGGSDSFQFNKSSVSLIVGNANNFGGVNSFAVGASNTPSGLNSAAFGLSNNSSGSQAFCVGESNTTSAQNAVCIGQGNNATQQDAMAIGAFTTAEGVGSFASGNGDVGGKAHGHFSSTFGFGSLASGYTQMAIGNFNVGQGTQASTSPGDHALIIGNGASNAARSNSVVFTNDGKAILYGTTSGNFSQSAAAATTSYGVKWPAAQGSASTVLTNDGSGNLSWTAVSSGANQSLSNLTSPTAINQDLIFALGSNGTIKTADSPGGSSGNININSGTPSAAGNSGSLNFITAAVVDGSSGAITIKSGNATGTGDSSDIELGSGDVVTGPSGSVYIFSGSAGGSNENTGDLNFNTGSDSSANSYSGNMNFQTGDGDQQSGGFLFRSGTATSGPRGHIQFKDGTEGTSGYVWTSIDTVGNGAWMPASGGGGSPAGSDTQIQFNNSGAFGANSDFAFITADTTLVVGNSNTTSGSSDSLVVGTNNTTSGSYELAVGDGNNVSGYAAAAIGYQGTASANYSVMLGKRNQATGDSSIALGNTTQSQGLSSFSSGDHTNASQDYSTAMGTSTEASGLASFAIGASTIASGDYSSSLGNTTTAQGYAQFVIGTNNIAQGTGGSFTSGDELFIIGNGNPGPSNAFSVSNEGRVLFSGHLKSVQTTAPTIVANASAGTGASASVANATDVAGQISLTTGTVGLSTGSYATLTFNKPYAVAPICVLTPAGSALSSNVYVTSTTTTMTINFALAGGVTTTYLLNYHCIETQ